MKHLRSPVDGATETQIKVPTRRAVAKQQTRGRVLAAARVLFSAQGYEGATIRDIAAAAGMSTGAVFANFSDKSDLFREIMVSDMERLLAQMQADVVGATRVDDAVLKLFDAGYSFYQSELPLARAAFGVSWSPRDGHVLRGVPPVQAMRDLIADQLRAGIVREELSSDSNVKLRSEMLFDAYLSNFPQAIFGGSTLNELRTKAREQIRVILAGARRG